MVQALKLFVVCLCATYLIFQGSKCLDRFLRTETKIVQKNRLSEESTFLGFTICPAYQDAYKVEHFEKKDMHYVIQKNICFSRHY